MSSATAEVPTAEAEVGLADTVDKSGGPSLEAMEEAAAPVLRRLGKKFPSLASHAISKMRASLEDLRAGGKAGEAIEKIFAEAHDIRGQSQTFGFDSLGKVADSLSEFIVGNEERAQQRTDLIEVHIDAMELCLGRETDASFEGPEADKLMVNLQKAVSTVWAAAA